ncbi:MAG TPA: NifU family protein [Candidatus Kapabacteria bacterium]|nr:NifU family protein [Candidatus Kapabacteria bacterium]HYM36118.1 NifU family protein [Steroidobacteraceae bacterium]
MSPLQQRIESALDECRPFLAKDGGGIEFVRFDETHGIAEVRYTGACKTCPMKLMTLRAGIERSIQYYAPEVKRIEELSE